MKGKESRPGFEGKGTGQKVIARESQKGNAETGSRDCNETGTDLERMNASPTKRKGGNVLGADQPTLYGQAGRLCS